MSLRKMLNILEADKEEVRAMKQEAIRRKMLGAVDRMGAELASLRRVAEAAAWAVEVKDVGAWVAVRYANRTGKPAPVASALLEVSASMKAAEDEVRAELAVLEGMS